MTLPPKVRTLFDPEVSLSGKDAQRLAPFLRHWGRLFPVLAQTNESDLKRLITLELVGARRRRILDRLLMRLGRLQRRRLQERIERAVTLTPTK